MTVTTAVVVLPRRMAVWATRRALARTSLTGIWLACAISAAAWFSAGTRGAALAGGAVLGAGYLARRIGSQLVVPARGDDSPEPPPIRWLSGGTPPACRAPPSERSTAGWPGCARWPGNSGCTPGWRPGQAASGPTGSWPRPRRRSSAPGPWSGGAGKNQPRPGRRAGQ